MSGQAHAPEKDLDLLVYKREIQPFEVIEASEVSLPPNRCPNTSTVLVERGGNRVVPGRCKRRTCPVCLRIDAWWTANAIALARPTQALLLTRVGDDWPTVNKRMTELRRSLNRKGLAGEWVYHVEPNPAGTGAHVHVWQRGADGLPEHTLSTLAQAAGMGAVATVAPIRRRVGWAEGQLHGVDAMAYAMKLARQDVPDGEVLLHPLQLGFLEANGGRLQHASRGFYRDGAGAPVAGVEGATAAVRRLRSKGRRSGWTAMSPGSARTYLALPVAA